MAKRNENKIAAVLLTSVGLANIGEWIYFIGLNLIILNNGGTAWSVGLLYIIRPVAGILTNIAFSSSVDRLAKRTWMMLLSILRGLLVGSLLFNQDLWYIYLVVFCIQICSSIYEPLSLGYTVLAISKNKLKRFNSWNSLVNSGGFLLGPAIAGLLLTQGPPLLTFFVNALVLFLSALLIFTLPEYNLKKAPRQSSFFKTNQQAFTYLKSYYLKNRKIVFFFCWSPLCLYLQQDWILSKLLSQKMFSRWMIVNTG